MARTDSRRKKEKRFKQASRRRRKAAQAKAAELERLREEVRERGFEVIEFKITHDPIPDPLVDGLSEADRAEIERVYAEVLRDPAPQRKALERLVDRHPEIPTLWNLLTASVNAGGDEARADQLAEETFRRFPTYVFGVAQWCLCLLGSERVEEVTRILDGRLGIAAWWPERREYHATEFIAFNAMLGHYFLAIGEHERAEVQLELIADVLPDHPAVHALENAMLRKALRILTEEYRQAPSEIVVRDSRAGRLLNASGEA